MEFRILLSLKLARINDVIHDSYCANNPLLYTNFIPGYTQLCPVLNAKHLHVINLPVYLLYESYPRSHVTTENDDSSRFIWISAIVFNQQILINISNLHFTRDSNLQMPNSKWFKVIPIQSMPWPKFRIIWLCQPIRREYSGGEELGRDRFREKHEEDFLWIVSILPPHFQRQR